MLSAERHSIILQELDIHRTVTIEALSKLLKVSDNTVRRDLAELQKKGKLERIQGGAVAPTGFSFQSSPKNSRMQANSGAKTAIAKEAAKLLLPGKSYIIDAGTTTRYLVPYICNTEGITVLTNSLYICNEAEPKATSTVIGCGGVILHAIQSFAGKPAEEFFSSTNADFLFLGAKGINEDGLYNENYFESPVKAKMIEAAEKIVLLIDSSKMGRNGLSRFATLNDVDLIITDQKADPNFVSMLRNQSIEVILAK